MLLIRSDSCFFFFNDTATTEIYTLPYTTLFRSLRRHRGQRAARPRGHTARPGALAAARSEENTSELQSQPNLVCRLLLEKKQRFGGGHRRRPRSSGRACSSGSTVDPCAPSPTSR